MIEVTILIPVADNAGLAFDPAHDLQWDAELIRLFGGFTRLPGLAAGGWADAGVTYHDQTRAYMVFVPGVLAAGPALIAAADFAKAHYGQLAVTVRYLGQAEIL